MSTTLDMVSKKYGLTEELKKELRDCIEDVAISDDGLNTNRVRRITVHPSSSFRMAAWELLARDISESSRRAQAKLGAVLH